MPRNVEPEEPAPVIAYMAVGMLLLCVPLAALLIVGAESTLEGIAMIAVLAVVGLLYGLLAVWSDERAHRDEPDGHD